MQKKYLALGIGGIIGAAIALKFSTREATVRFEEFADSIANSEHSKFVEVDGVEIHYQEFGDSSAPAMILIHGYTSSTYSWKTVAPQLAEAGFRVIAIDLVGYGYSEKPSYFEYTIASQARIIERFMDTLGIGKAIIVGSSYGGAVASWFTLDYPERVEKLILVGAVINDDPKRFAVLRVANLPGIGELITPFLADSKSVMKMRMRGTLYPNSHHLITKDRIDSVIRPLKAADGHHSLLATSRNWDANRIENDAHLIEQQTLLIWGDNDTVIPSSIGDKYYDRILNSRLVVFKNCGHVPHEEYPELFVNLVSDFVRDRRGKIGENDGKENDADFLEIKN